MSRNIHSNELKTEGFVLRRTNYGEADRILNIITPHGKVAAIAKGVRRERSKLAGGVELFSLVELNIHLGRGELGVVTSARMKKYYARILNDYARVELATSVLKRIDRVAEGSDNPELFGIVSECLSAIDGGVSLDLVESWWLLNMCRAAGEDINLYRDVNGKKLQPDGRYVYDAFEKAFMESVNGEYGANEIKTMRLMLVSKISTVNKIKDMNEVLPKVLSLARMLGGAV